MSRNWPLAALGVMVWSLSRLAAAAEWSIEPYTTFHYDWTNNYRYLQSGSDPGYDISVSPGFSATERSETTSFTWTAAVSAVHNSVVDPRNRIDANTSLNWQYRDERDTYAATITYLRDLTLASELTTTGYLNNVVQRNFYAFSPSYSRALTERWSLGVGGSISWARYSQTGENGLDNYENYSVSPSLTYVLSPQTQITGGMGFAWYNGSPIENRTTSYSATIGVTHKYSERLTLAATVGYAHTHAKYEGLLICLVPVNVNGQLGVEQLPTGNCPVPLTNTGASDTTTNTPVYNISANWGLSETTTVTAAATQAIIPSGLGTTLDAKTLNLGLAHSFTERLSGNVGAAWTDSKVTGTSTGVGSSTYRAIEASLHYALSVRWTVDGGYRFSQVVYSNAPNLSAHLLYVSLRYNFARMAFSR